jgi:glycosyltransferase involved in cell wall biosynthesis
MISIVITTFYRNDKLPKAIESAIDQTYDGVEIVVVDGSGEEHAREVASSYDVQYVAQDENEGIAADRDLGVQTATHDLIHFLDDDDRLGETAIERKVVAYNENDEVGVVYSGIKWDGGHEVLPDPRVRGDVLRSALAFEMSPCLPSTMLIERDLLTQIMPMADLPGDDGPMKIELARLTNFDFVKATLTQKGNSENALSSGGEDYDESDESVRLNIIDYYDDLYTKTDPELKRKALRRSYLLEAAVGLENNFWSLDSVRHMVLANYYSKGFDAECVAGLIASLFGSPVWQYGRKIHTRYFLGDSHSGSIG